MLECLTALLALSHANAKGRDIDSEGWAFRCFSLVKRVVKEEEVRSLQEISKKLSGNLKIEIPSC